MSRTDPAGKPWWIADDIGSVRVQKLHTPRGERLEFTAPARGTSIRLDAIMAEAVTWQRPEQLAARAASLDWPTEIDESDSTGTNQNIRIDSNVQEDDLDGPDEHAAVDERDYPIQLRNEYAHARVEKAIVDGREQLVIEATKLGYEIRLERPILEWLTTQDHESFTAWLETPFGPDADDH